MCNRRGQSSIHWLREQWCTEKHYLSTTWPILERATTEKHSGRIIQPNALLQRGSALQGQCRLYFDSLGIEACLQEKDAHWREVRQGQIMRNILFWPGNVAGFVLVGSGVCLEVCKCTLLMILSSASLFWGWYFLCCPEKRHRSFSFRQHIGARLSHHMSALNPTLSWSWSCLAQLE